MDHPSGFAFDVDHGPQSRATTRSDPEHAAAYGSAVVEIRDAKPRQRVGAFTP
jgi:hypothetical protein